MSEPTINIPAFLPQLRHGTGTTPKDGGCLVQVAGFLYDGRSWRDDVECVHPVLRRAGIAVNDRLDEVGLRRLSLLTARISGSNDAVDGWSEHDRHVLNVRLAVWAAESVEHLVRRQDRKVVRAALEAATGWCEGKVSTANANAAANAAAYAADAAAYAVYAAAYAAAAAAYAADAAVYAAAYAAAAAANAANAAAYANDLVDWYTALVDEYDRLTNRVSHNLTEHQAAAIHAVLGVA